MFFAPSKVRQRAKIQNMGPPKTSDHIQIKIKMPNPSQVPPVSSKALNKDLKDMDILCTFKIKTESQNLEDWVYQRPLTTSQSRSKCQTSVRNLQFPSNPQIWTLMTHMFFVPPKSNQKAKIGNMIVPKTNGHIQIKIKIPNTSQKLPASCESTHQE